jgi:hypothetical protein
MPLSLSQKSNVRRHLGYPLIGLPRISPAGGTLAAGTTSSYRYFQAYGMLEFRLNNLNMDEESRLLGSYYGGLSVIGPTPGVGDTLVVTFSGGNLVSPVVITVTVTAPMIIPTPPNPVYVNSNAGLGIVMTLAQLVLQNTALQAAKITGFAPYSTGSFANAAIPLPEVAFTSPVPFSLSVSTTGLVAAQIIMDGSTPLSPSLPTMPGLTTAPIFGYMPILDYLESAYGGATQNLDTSKADVWSARMTELPERMSQYMIWREKLSEFLAIPVNPDSRNNYRDKGLTAFA